MTDKQYACLTFVTDYTCERGYPPLYREVAEGCGIHVNTVYKWFVLFEAMGYVQTARGWRGVKVLRLPGKRVA